MPSKQFPPLSSQVYGQANVSNNNNNNEDNNFAYPARRPLQRTVISNNTQIAQTSNFYPTQVSTGHHVLQPHSSNQRLQQPTHKQVFKKFEAHNDEENVHEDTNNNAEEANEENENHHDNNQGDGQHSHNYNHSVAAENFHLPQLRATSSAASKGDYFPLSRARDLSFPLNPQTAAKVFQEKLSAYELTEIYSYRNIYFVGPNANKLQGVRGSSNNDGYDDEQCSYMHVPHDHIAYRYEVGLICFLNALFVFELAN